ncbi:MAG TPA: hypothetical protein VIP82_04195 [Microbacterium sp.]|uniref:hypothetical protein n=1 Tax=Microbacterium sp. TaxID=51671 RepID=UPI002F930211
MSDRTLTSLVDEVDEWGPVDWWRLELRSFVTTPYAQHALVVLAPKEAVRAEHTGVRAGSCLQSLAYMFLLVAPLVGAAAMLRWVAGGSAFDFPLAFAGVLTLISFLATAWSEYQRFRHPRAVSQSGIRTTTLMHIVPGLFTALIAITAGRELLGDGTWVWLVVILADVVVYAAILVRGVTIKDGPQNPHDNVDQSVKEIPPSTLSGIMAERDAAIDLLVARGKITADVGAEARATAPGWLALTLAPQAGSAYYRPDQA